MSIHPRRFALIGAVLVSLPVMALGLRQTSPDTTAAVATTQPTWTHSERNDGYLYVETLTPLEAPEIASESVEAIAAAATSTEMAVRIEPPPTTTTIVPVPAGLHGRPFAPDGLSDCDEMNWYRVQWGLPERFDGIGRRESNCRNEDGVRTWCCYGYWQLYVGLFLKDHRMAPRFADCDIDSYEDVNSDTPLDKQRQACGAKELLDVQGIGAWAATK